MSRLDLKKALKEFYGASPKKPKIADVPKIKFIRIAGRCSPDGPAYSSALNALYSLYTKSSSNTKLKQRTFFMTFRGLWLRDNPSITDIVYAPSREEWNRKSIIRIPDFVTENIVEYEKKCQGEKGRRRG